jgi:hypothetical protein
MEYPQNRDIAKGQDNGDLVAGGEIMAVAGRNRTGRRRPETREP